MKKVVLPCFFDDDNLYELVYKEKIKFVRLNIKNLVRI